MIACVGQQTLSGHRIPDGFGDRTLPHFEKNSRTPPAKGFVQNSYFTGMTPTEFFFHAMGGREGLVDSAVKTAETGYMQRRLMKALEDLSAKYDYSVRTSSNEIAQFIYGDDGLDPMMMDEGNKPVNFMKLLAHLQNKYPSTESIYPMQIHQIYGQLTLEIDSHEMFMADLKASIDQVALTSGDIRAAHGLLRGDSSEEIDQIDPNDRMEKLVRKLINLNPTVISEFVKIAMQKHFKAKIIPGEAVGAVAGQSIGEPSTQMTLKTFHFAGVDSMNISLGVPRIKEIINAVKQIATPIITAKLHNETDLIAAKVAKGQITKTILSHIAKSVQQIYSPGGCYIQIELDREVIENLKLELSAEKVRQAILTNGKLKLKEHHITNLGDDRIKVDAYDSNREKMFFVLQELRNRLIGVRISGIPTVERAIINRDEKDDSKYHIAVEGYGLKEVMSAQGIDYTKTLTNHVIECEQVLGIEAARSTIISEIRLTMDQYGISIDYRHLNLLADVMTCRGNVLGITRFGVQKMRDSTLMLASFEKTTDHLFDSAVRGRRDDIEGVSECIIMGLPIPLGTGLFKLLYKPNIQKSRVPFKRKKLIFS